MVEVILFLRVCMVLIKLIVKVEFEFKLECVGKLLKWWILMLCFDGCFCIIVLIVGCWIFEGL